MNEYQVPRTDPFTFTFKAQFPVTFEHYGLKAQVVGVMDLLGKAIII